MSWQSALLDSLLDRLAAKLAQRIEIELNAAIDVALDQTEDRLREILKGAEDRLLAAGQQSAPLEPSCQCPMSAENQALQRRCGNTRQWPNFRQCACFRETFDQ